MAVTLDQERCSARDRTRCLREQAAHHPNRGRERMDRIGEDVERRSRLDREEDLVALDARRVGELDDVSTIAPGHRTDMGRANACPDVDALPAEGGVEGG